MKISALLSLVPLVAAIPGKQAKQAKQAKSSDASFGVISARSASPIHLQPLNAVGGYFYLGGNAQSYCPEGIPGCQQTNETVITGGHFLDVMVPGGQAIFVDPKGALRFTSPHSAYEPAGSSDGPFTYTPGNTFGHWSYEGQGASGFMACPTNGTTTYRRSRRSAAAPKWQVYAALQNATVPSGSVSDCIGFDALAVADNSTTPATWEYI